MSLALGQNRSYIQGISSGRSLPSMAQFLKICDYFEITPLQFFDFIGKLPVRRMNLFASSLAYIKEIVKSEFGIPVDANGYALCTGNQISAYGGPLLSCCQNRNILVLCVHKKYVVKTVLMELRCKCQIIPPVVFISDNIGSHDFIYRPQAFIISQRYLTSFLYW